MMRLESVRTNFQSINTYSYRLQIPTIVPSTQVLQFPFSYFLFSFILNSADPLSLSPPVEPLFYFYPFHQNFLTHMLSFYFLHSLVHSFLNRLFNKHSLKAIHLFTI